MLNSDDLELKVSCDAWNQHAKNEIYNHENIFLYGVWLSYKPKNISIYVNKYDNQIQNLKLAEEKLTDMVEKELEDNDLKNKEISKKKNRIENAMSTEQEHIQKYVKSTLECIINNDLESLNCDSIAKDLSEIISLLWDFDILKNKKVMLDEYNK